MGMIDEIIDMVLDMFPLNPIGNHKKSEHFNEEFTIKLLKVKPLRNDYHFLRDERFVNRRIRRIRK